MAQAYTSARGKNKKGKLGDRKDANNNAANKLSQKLVAEKPLEFLSAADLTPKTLGNSATARKREALEAARASLQKVLTGACGNKACASGATLEDTGKQLLLCVGCKQKAYCNVECQKADWKEHKAACKEAQAKKAAEEDEAKKGTGKGGKGQAALKAASSDAASSSSSSSSSAAPTPAAAQATPAPAAASSAPAAAAASPAAAPVTDASSLD